jgi:hypothetical protein
MELPFPKLGELTPRTTLLAGVVLWIGLIAFVLGLGAWLADSARGPVLVLGGLAAVLFGFFCDAAARIDGGCISHQNGPTMHFTNWPYVWKAGAFLLLALAVAYVAAWPLLPPQFKIVN